MTEKRMRAPRKPKQLDSPQIALRKRIRVREMIGDFMEELHELGFRTLTMSDVQMDGHYHALLVIDDGEVNPGRLESLVSAVNKRGHRLSLKEDHVTRQSRLVVWVNHG